MEVEDQLNTWEGYVDWRNRPAIRGCHGGMYAASFVLAVEVLENLAYLANASNLVRYLSDYMHFSSSESANTVTNFMGTAFLLALLGGFLSDAFFTTYFIYLISAAIEFLGLVILTVQAHSVSLKPPQCVRASKKSCHQVHGAKAVMLFVGLYLVALGVGGIKGCLPVHGAEQFDGSTPKGRKLRSTFFNYFVFCLAGGALIAVTFVVWIEDNKGWEWGFGVSTLTILLSVPVFLAGSSFYRSKTPCGSPITTIFKVLVAATINSCLTKNSSTAIANMSCPSPSPSTSISRRGGNTSGKGMESTESETPRRSLKFSIMSASPSPPTKGGEEMEAQETEPTESQSPRNSLEFLNRAVVEKPVYGSLECSKQEVEDVKVVLKILPIFGCTIMLNCCLAQLSTFSVHQAATMDTNLGSLKVPPASLPIFPVLFIMILAPVYDHFIIPIARNLTKTEMGITHLQRIGVGLILSIVAMAVAALVEIKRKRVAAESGLLESAEKFLPITFFWISFQYLFLGSADLFTLAGLMEFFFTEAPASMRSLATSLSFASLAMGYYLSTVIVFVVNSITGRSNHRPWLAGESFNLLQLDRFYWLICVLSTLNFFHYLYWAMRYKYRSIRDNNGK